MELNSILLGTAFVVFLVELLKGPETGFDLVLLAGTMISLSQVWGIRGFTFEGMVLGLVLFISIKALLKLTRPQKVL